MSRTIQIDVQSFVKLRQNNYFYIDKTRFIKEWWNSYDRATLITRPRYFGKTLMLDTVNTFFSPEFAGSSLFEGLQILEDEKFRNMQGTIPVIFISFANIKCQNYDEAIKAIKEQIVSVYKKFLPRLNENDLSEREKEIFASLNNSMSDVIVKESLSILSHILFMQYKTMPIILLDNWDTPLYAAWLNGYYKELNRFINSLLISTFKVNRYFIRGLITGITHIQSDMILSSCNNVNIVYTTSQQYSDCFGFTEDEVSTVMDEYGLTEKEEVKQWYGGFTFGSQTNIYNPWSIINYLAEKKFLPYLEKTTSNALIRDLITRSTSRVKDRICTLLQDKTITVRMDKHIVFSQLFRAIWSFLMAAGYVKPIDNDVYTSRYTLKITNLESQTIFENIISA